MKIIIIKRNDLLKSEICEKYMEAIFLSLFFLNDSKSNFLILKNEFFTGRIFRFLEAENHNYLYRNEFINVFDMLFSYFSSHFTQIIQNICKIYICKQNYLLIVNSYVEIEITLKILSTLVLYKQNSNIFPDFMSIFRLVSENMKRFPPKSHRSLFRNMLNLLIILSKTTILKKKIDEENKFEEVFSNENVKKIKKLFKIKKHKEKFLDFIR